MILTINKSEHSKVPPNFQQECVDENTNVDNKKI